MRSAIQRAPPCASLQGGASGVPREAAVEPSADAPLHRGKTTEGGIAVRLASRPLGRSRTPCGDDSNSDRRGVGGRPQPHESVPLRDSPSLVHPGIDVRRSPIGVATLRTRIRTIRPMTRCDRRGTARMTTRTAATASGALIGSVGTAAAVCLIVAGMQAARLRCHPPLAWLGPWRCSRWSVRFHLPIRLGAQRVELAWGEAGLVLALAMVPAPWVGIDNSHCLAAN